MKVLRSFCFAFSGIRYCFKAEVNFRVHCIAVVVAVTLGVALHISNTEWLMIILAIGAVICLEIINTIIEKLCDIIHPEQAYKIKIIKDMAAAAVLIAAVISLITGCFIFLPKIFK